MRLQGRNCRDERADKCNRAHSLSVNQTIYASVYMCISMRTNLREWSQSHSHDVRAIHKSDFKAPARHTAKI